MSRLFRNPHFLLIGIVISMMIWGISWPSAKVLSRYGGPLEIALIRFVFTFLGVFVLLKAIRVKIFIQRAGIPSLLGASVLMAGYSLLFFSGILHGMPGAGGVLVTTTTPLVAFLLAVLFSGRKLIGREYLGLGIGLCAGFFLLSLWNRWSHVFESGNLYFLGSTVVWGFLSRFTGQSHRFGSPLAFSLWIYFFCILILGTLAPCTKVWRIVQHGDALFWFNMIFNAVINTGLATTFYFYGTSKLGPEKTSSFIYIVPFAAALSSLFFIGETLQWNTIVGGLLAILSVYIINRKKKSGNDKGLRR